jgi:hypothetical protein
VPLQDHVLDFWNEIDTDRDGSLTWNEFASRFPTALKLVHKKQHPKPNAGIDWCELVLPPDSKKYVAGRLEELRVHAEAEAEVAETKEDIAERARQQVHMSKDPNYVARERKASKKVAQYGTQAIHDAVESEDDDEAPVEKENDTPFWYNKRTGASVTPSVQECLFELCRESDADVSGDLDFDEYVDMLHSPSLGLHMSIATFMGTKLWQEMKELNDSTIFVDTGSGELRCVRITWQDDLSRWHP